MSWFQRLYDTYETCEKNKGKYKIAPVAHTHKVCNIEVTLNEEAEIVDAQIIDEDTIIPTTDDNNCLWSLATDIKTYQKEKDEKGKELKVTYKKHLKEWAEVDNSNIKLQIINNCIQKNVLIQKLVEKEILWLDSDNKFIKKPKNKIDITDKYKIFQFAKKQEDVFIRWIVGTDINRQTWKDKRFIDSWINFRKQRLKDEISEKINKKSKTKIGDKNIINKTNKIDKDMCYITGKHNTLIAIKHPTANGSSKLISSQDDKNFIFNGRFIKQNEVLNIDFDVTNQAHKTLDWLISDERKQAYRNYPQIIVAFTVNGKGGNVGQVFGEDFVKSIKGYNTSFEQFEENENIVVLEMDAASKGRACITYYREMLSSKYLKNIETWHKKYSWEQFLKIKNDEGKDEYKYFIGAPSINTIADTYFYKKDRYKIEKNEQKIKKKIIKDLMPSVLEDRNITEYIEKHFIEKASNPVALNESQWKTILRIACSIYKGNHLYIENKKEEEYLMSDETCEDRNYLYGRLLAVIDDAERAALWKQNKDNGKAKESIRQTNAQRLMRQFSIKPFDTWKVLYEKFNDAYKKRINGTWVEDRIEKIKSKFISVEKFTDNAKLTGLYLLGYFHELKDIKETRKTLKQDKQDKEIENGK
jgi:CRISPR-associated protein Csd1